MAEKEKILEAWIMVEHLSEGDISDKSKDILTLDGLKNNDYYTLLINKINEHEIYKKKKGGIAVYFDVFDFNEVVSILREQYNLKPTEEEITTGNKFSFVLVFDKKLNFINDMTFFTESAYIRYYKKVPLEPDFRKFEEELKIQLAQDFDESNENPQKFNGAILKQLNKFNITADKCRIQPVNNVENDTSNLHSFFIEDLETAKKISTFNLDQYLFGDTENRVNLDSKKDSPSFNPIAFTEILKPENYPLGRFPGNTKFALSLMQQVAVNLATGYDDKSIRSVNGPPGTGKTTLLKDIFAQLIVEQAFDIAKLTQHNIAGTEETVYFKNASIGVLPEEIAQNSIVVASSNNGAVQNIVNELPLIKGQIDEKLADELMSVDYFRQIANSAVRSQWIEDSDGKKHEEIIMEPNEGEDKFWGLFSLEGGKADNMNKIINNIKCVEKYLNEEFEPDGSVYNDFLKQYDKVKSLRDDKQKVSESISRYQSACYELNRNIGSYSIELEKRRLNLNQQVMETNGILHKLAAEQAEKQRLFNENETRKAEINELMEMQRTLVDMINKRKPGLLAAKGEKDRYRSDIEAANSKSEELMKQSIACKTRENSLKNEIYKLNSSIKSYSDKLTAIQQDFEAWDLSEERKTEELKQKTESLKSGYDSSLSCSLDMNLDYDKLHLSNPWFDEEYRIAQSELFIKALAVRKQFLYENRKNIKAATIIWGSQKKYFENKKVIVAAWGWINLTIPVISSTFASFSRMCKNLGVNTLGHLFVDEAGQALPQASVGAVFRSKNVMVVGDPSQIKPVLTVDSSVLSMLGKHFGVTEKYLSDSASTQTLVDSASRFGFYKEQDKSEDSWIGIPLWVHRRCQYPMFTISNEISYNGFMVQGNPANGKTGWFDVKGKAKNKYVEEQGEFLLRKIRKMAEENPKILDKNEKDIVYVISPFANVAFQLAQKLRTIGFTRYDEKRKPTNVGTIHTFQGKEAPIVFMVLGADTQSSGAARWAVGEPNMMNVAATRAKKEFYVVGDRNLYNGIGSIVAEDTLRIISVYSKHHPELVDNDVASIMSNKAYEKKLEQTTPITGKTMVRTAQNAEKPVERNTRAAEKTAVQVAPTTTSAPAAANGGGASAPRITGKIKFVGNGKSAKYAYVTGDNKTEYTINETIFSRTENAETIIQRGNRISFVPHKENNKLFATQIKPV